MNEVIKHPRHAFASPGSSTSSRASDSGWRHTVWAAQVSAGHEPCFGTAYRFVCDEASCPWRRDCLRLRAEWRR